MKAINKLLKKNSLRTNNYVKIGNVVKIDTKNGQYIIKNKTNNRDIFNYLVNKNFNYYPDIIDYDDKYEIIRYVDEISIPIEQKMNDLIKLVALLHSKTAYYKEIDDVDYKSLYEDLNNNIEYLKEYYLDLITIIESKVFMSPKEYLMARNISIVFNSLDICKNILSEWLKKIKGIKKMRVAVIHNNLKLSHFIKNNSDYLISWNKSKIDLPIFDLYKLYNNHSIEFDFYEIFKKYEKIFPLTDYELDLLFVLILMPNKIDFDGNDYNVCKIIGNEIEKIYKTKKLIENYKDESP